MAYAACGVLAMMILIWRAMAVAVSAIRSNWCHSAGAVEQPEMERAASWRLTSSIPIS